MTGPERLLWWKLRARQFLGLKFRRQHGIGPYIVDFYCAERSLVIEIDGDTHAEPNQIQKDVLRDRYLQSLGLHVVRYRNDDILKNLDGVLYDLEKRVSEKKRPPLPLLTKEGNDRWCPPLTKERNMLTARVLSSLLC